MVRDHFEKRTFAINPRTLSDKEKIKLMLDRYMKDEIDIEIYKRSEDFFHSNQREVDDKVYM